MFKPFKRPINMESLNSWAKNLDEIARIAILASPVVVYSPYEIGLKVLNMMFLVLFSYFCVYLADFIRRNKTLFSSDKE